MNFLKKLFCRKKNKETEIKETTIKKKEPALIPKNKAPSTQFYTENKTFSKEAVITPSVFETLRDSFIAFDVETTGLSPSVDRIIEIGAVVFEKGEPLRLFNTLVNPGRHIPAEASCVNGITDAMVRNAPSEHEAIAKLASFIGDALSGKTYLCAHNASFDMNFLVAALSRQHVEASIFYIDTLYLAKRYIDSDYIYNYKLGTLLSHFNIENDHLHRAKDDAMGCGKLAIKLFDLMTGQIEKLKKSYESSVPREEELEICAVIQKIISDADGDTSLLGYYRYASGIIEVQYVYSILRFKIAKKKRYVIIKSDAIESDINIQTEPCSSSEARRNYIRVLFDNPLELYLISDAIMKIYKEEKKYADSYLYSSRWAKDKYLSSPAMNNAISNERIQELVQSAEQRYKIRKVEEQRSKEEQKEKALEFEKKREAERIEKERLREEKRLQQEQKLQAEKKPSTPSKPVLQYDQEGNFICKFNSIKEAARSVSISPNGIRNVASGKAKTAGGYVWKFADIDEIEKG